MRKNKKNKREKRKKIENFFKTLLKISFKILVFPVKFFLKIPGELKRILIGLIFLLFFLFFVFSFYEKGGVFGKFLILISQKIFGKATFTLPLTFFLISLSLFFSPYKNISLYLLLSFLLVSFGTSAFLGREGGKVGIILSSIFEKVFGPLISKLLFSIFVIFGLLIFYFLSRKERPAIQEKKPSIFKRIFAPSFKVEKIEKEKEEKKIEEKEKKEVLIPKTPQIEPEYQKPPLELLEKETEKPLSGDIKQNIIIIKKTLENFGIPVEMGEVNIGPTVTQYTLKPAEGVKLSKITSLANDLALALAAHPIRIEAPIPGKSLVGIEVPNRIRSKVRLRDLISLPQFQNAISPLTFVLGRDVSGNPAFADLTRMPHLLVAGATGTGKTIMLNSLILSLIYRNSPKILNFILIDPKRVEFSVYNDLPHLLTNVIFDAQKTVNALKWLIEEMERRFEELAKAKTRDIFSYNKLAFEKKISPMPYIVLIIDELADLMAAKGREIEAAIVRLAQLARAVGIHLVLATQRPSTEVITGLIKANITARIAFQVASQVDSRTILDTAGAEKLLGMGDMLFYSPEIGKPKRIQGAYVSEDEVKKVVQFLSSKYSRTQIESLEEKLLEEFGEEIEFPESFETDDPLYEEAKRIVIEARKASASLLQRRLKIGYARAARLLDMLEERGIVGPARGSKPREVYIKEDEGWKKI